MSLKANNLWLDAIPKELPLDSVINKYNFKNDKVTAILGEYDDPSSQRKGPVSVDITSNGNSYKTSFFLSIVLKFFSFGGIII